MWVKHIIVSGILIMSENSDINSVILKMSEKDRGKSISPGKEVFLLTDVIFDQVMRIRKRFHTSDPFELLKRMGVVLIFSDAFPRDGLRGFCTVMNRIRYVVINAKQPEEEQRVVAAHEAAHLILHMDRLKAGAMRDFGVYNVTSRLERQANFFAADFLIDDEEVLDQMQTSDGDFLCVAKKLLIPAPFFQFKLYSMVNRGYSMRVPGDLNATFLKSSGWRG